jgi:membrane protein YqaA with SNARE-associated domain
MLRRLYDWTLSLAARKSAEWWLFIIAFVESSVFLVPAEVLLVPMGLARPERAYRYAVLATIGSVLGGIAGWFLGYYAYELIARPVLEFYGSLHTSGCSSHRRLSLAASASPCWPGFYDDMASRFASSSRNASGSSPSVRRRSSFCFMSRSSFSPGLSAERVVRLLLRQDRDHDGGVRRFRRSSILPRAERSLRADLAGDSGWAPRGVEWDRP